MHKTDSGQWLWDNEEPIDYTNWGPEDRFTEEIIAKREKVGAVMTFVEGEWHAVAPGDLFWDYTITQVATYVAQSARLCHKRCKLGCVKFL